MTGIMPTAGVPANQTQNALTNPDLTAGCAATWYAPRCNPKFDPFAANAVLSEILNLVNCCDLEYDCTRLDNMCRAVQRCIRNALTDCMPAFPSVGNSCSIQQLVLATDGDGCRRIALYTEASAQLAEVNTGSAWPSPTSVLFPANPADQSTYYDRAEIIADQNAHTLNEPMLALARLFVVTFDVPCAGTLVEFIGNHGVLLQPTANGGNGASGCIVPRVDGTFPQVAVPQTVIAGRATNFQNVCEFTWSRVFSAGTHTVEFYWVAFPGTQLAQINISYTAGVTASGAVSARKGIS